MQAIDARTPTRIPGMHDRPRDLDLDRARRRGEQGEPADDLRHARGTTSRCQVPAIQAAAAGVVRSFPVEERTDRSRQQTDCGHRESDTTSGLVSYLDGEPVGSCAVKPRSAYEALARNNATLPPAIVAEKRGWGGRAGWLRATPAASASRCWLIRALSPCKVRAAPLGTDRRSKLACCHPQARRRSATPSFASGGDSTRSARPSTFAGPTSAFAEGHLRRPRRARRKWLGPRSSPQATGSGHRSASGRLSSLRMSFISSCRCRGSVGDGSKPYVRYQSRAASCLACTSSTRAPIVSAACADRRSAS